MLITLQYLEYSQKLTAFSPERVRNKLNFAFDTLPITHLLVGWQLPVPLLELCRKECEHAGIKFFRWHPLLTGDGTIYPRSEWQVVGLNGDKIPGFQNKPEFTFVCPNHPDATGEILDHLQQIIDSDLYQGIFLDRIRFPSPTTHPLQHLGCFCKQCQKAAFAAQFDIANLRKMITIYTASQGGKISLIQALLGDGKSGHENEFLAQMRQWMIFREKSITNLLGKVTKVIRPSGLEIGLDCFSPGFTFMVGQDLESLSNFVDWIKVMIYGHTLGPGGLPFEILGLLDFLMIGAGLTEVESINLLSSMLKIPLPNNQDQLRKNGLNAEALSLEIRKGINTSKSPVLAGVELVEAPGITFLNDKQILGDLQAVMSVGAAGISLSWDLWNIPEYRLKIISPILNDKS